MWTKIVTRSRRKVEKPIRSDEEWSWGIWEGNRKENYHTHHCQVSLCKTQMLEMQYKKNAFLLVPYRLAGGLLVCSLSVSLSVRHTSVFRTFLCCLLRYWLEIWWIDLSWQNTDQVRVLSRLTNFYRSYCTLLKYSFPEFSQPSFEILTWNLVYEFVMT